MQNTFSQSGNDSKWLLKKSFFRIGIWHSRPPPFMAKTIFNFHFEDLTPSLIQLTEIILLLSIATFGYTVCVKSVQENHKSRLFSENFQPGNEFMGTAVLRVLTNIRSVFTIPTFVLYWSSVSTVTSGVFRFTLMTQS